MMMLLKMLIKLNGSGCEWLGSRIQSPGAFGSRISAALVGRLESFFVQVVFGKFHFLHGFRSCCC